MWWMNAQPGLRDGVGDGKSRVIVPLESQASRLQQARLGKRRDE